MGDLARRQWRKKPNYHPTWDRPASPQHERSSYDAANGRFATIQDGVVREPRTGASASVYDGSHVSSDVRSILNKFSDPIKDKILNRANRPPAVKQEASNPWNWEDHAS